MVLVILSVSIGVSYYIYDLSGLYKLNWLNDLEIDNTSILLNIHAGFDETSHLLKMKFPFADLLVYDFYNEANHTEISIKRARNAYAPFENTQNVNVSDLPLKNGYADYIFIILSAHEIRSEKERHQFFTELNRVLKDSGKIIIVEHFRDLANFLAYNIGFFHFIAKSKWYQTFADSGFNICQENKITPFITNFILKKDGDKY